MTQCPECKQISLPQVKEDEFSLTAIACQNNKCRAIMEVQISPQFGVQIGKCVGYWEEKNVK